MRATTNFLLTFLLVLFVISLSLCSQLQGSELQTLLSVRSSINDPLNFLSDWSNSTYFCQWYGIICDNSSHVSKIRLSGKNLSGSFPLLLFSLPFINTVDLSSNGFSGEIPTEAFSPLPLSLRHLNLSSNNFSGSIHFASDGGEISLEVLDLSNNLLTGEIPDQIKHFSSLRILDLGGNFLKGQIPSSISNLKNLQFLTLASNDLTGRIPPELGKITTLQWIYLGYNNLSSQIPPEIGDLNSLEHLDLVYNNLTGGIPESVGNLRELRYLFLYQNSLSGSIPPSIFDLTELISLDLSDNNLTGEISESVIKLQNLEILHLFSNRFHGKIPRSIAALPRLRVLQLWANGISGDIPRNLGLGSNLTVLDLSTNNLTGEIPDPLCYSKRLYKLILFSNSLQGSIPIGLSRCRSLERVRLQNNRLSGDLPQEFTRLPLVYFLDISGNRFTGRIDGRRWEMPSLAMVSLANNEFTGTLPDSLGSENLENLDLSGNRFSGSIPSGFGFFSELEQLKLSKNQLAGPIPEEIANCKKLVSLDVSKNKFSGEIPAGLSGLPVLSDLDFSENQFSGEIPPDLGITGSLVSINVSYNSFHGSLPVTGAFLAVKSSEVIGNSGLCGGRAGNGLPPCVTALKKPLWNLSVTALTAVLLLLSLSVFVLLLIRRRRREFCLKKVEINGSGVWEVMIFDEGAMKLTTVDTFLTPNRDTKDMASNGSSNGTWFAVREMEEVPTGLGWREVTEVGRFRHRNVVRLAGACRSAENKRWTFIHKAVERGRSLGSGVALRELSWEKRCSVAIGIARGLRSLHSRYILSGSVSAEHVVLDGEDEPRLMFSFPGSVISSGYVPPEMKDGGGEYTEKSDVYSFGVLLMELLTGRCHVDSEMGAHGGIVEWARYCYSECHLDSWIDPAMRGQVGEHQGEMIKAMDLAVRCTSVEPRERPCMSEVLKALGSTRKQGTRGFCLLFQKLKLLS